MKTIAILGSELPPGPLDAVSHVNGARVATVSALVALLRHGTADRYHVVHVNEQLGTPEAYLQGLAGLGVDVKRVAVVPLPRLHDMVAETRYTAVHDPSGPDLARLAALVRPLAPEPTPCTCRGHSLSYGGGVTTHLASLIGATEPYDAVFCSSRDALTALDRLLHHLARGHRLPAGLPRHRLELAPLGIDVGSYEPAVPAATARRLLELPERGRWVSYVGRLSTHDKADLDVLLRVMARMDADRHLLLAGDDSQHYSRYLRARAQNLDMAERVHVLADVTESVKRLAIWAGDVFCSPVDSVQESFGLTVLEAMAAHRPVVVSDWGGYRDLVEEGRSGYLVPTTWGACTSAVDSQAELGVFMSDHVLLGQGVEVDEETLARRLSALLDEPGLAERVGEEASRRAAGFDWPVVVRRYEEIWDELKERALASPDSLRPPSRIPYADVFGHYATRILSPGDVVALRRGLNGAPPPSSQLQQLVSQAVLAGILRHLAGGPATVGELAPTETELLALLWLMKAGSVGVVHPEEAG